jgi:protein-L-isoaspartate(D-aspartate) O-methyltransferase
VAVEPAGAPRRRVLIAKARRGNNAALPFGGRCTIAFAARIQALSEGAMIDFTRLRRSMVDSQIRPNDVTDPRIIEAMLDLPRERFVPTARANLAYLDDDLSVSEGGGGVTRCLIEPMVLARLVQALQLSETDRALDIGGATGYSTALLARLARHVVMIEEDPTLISAARRNLSELSIDNVEFATGQLKAGAPGRGPFDAILLNGSVEVVPPDLLAQLEEGGRLAAVVQGSPPGRAILYVRAGGVVSQRPVFDAAVTPLPGFEAPRGFVF